MRSKKKKNQANTNKNQHHKSRPAIFPKAGFS